MKTCADPESREAGRPSRKVIHRSEPVAKEETGPVGAEQNAAG
jgi:hypothetical protein